MIDYRIMGRVHIFTRTILLYGILLIGCDYYEPVKPDDLKSPFKTLPDFYSAEYKIFEMDDVTLQMTEGDYKYGCSSHLYHREQINDRSSDFSNKIHFLASGGNPEVFEDNLVISIKYDLNDFQFEVVNTDIVIYKYDLYRGPHRNDSAYEILPGSVNDKQNQTVTAKGNTLRGSYILGRPK